MQEIKEALKEGLRVTLMAAVPIVINGLQQGAIDWRLVYISGIIALLRFVDKYLHELSKTEPVETRNTGFMGEKGLTGF